MQYIVFAMTPKLPYCSAGSAPGWDKWDATVDDWLQRTYARGKSQFAEWGQASGKNLGGGVGVVPKASRDAIDKAFYHGAEDETDAVAMEELLELSLVKKIPRYVAVRSKSRIDPVFGT